METDLKQLEREMKTDTSEEVLEKYSSLLEQLNNS